MTPGAHLPLDGGFMLAFSGGVWVSLRMRIIMSGGNKIKKRPSALPASPLAPMPKYK